MVMSELGSMIQYAILSWLALLFLVIMLKILRGDINTTGLVRTEPGGPVDPERVANLMLSLLGIGGYLAYALSVGAVLNPDTNTYALPDVPQSLVVLLGAGNSVYLAGKVIRKRG